MTISLRQTFVDASLHTLKITKVNGTKSEDVALVIRALDLSPANLAVALVFLNRYCKNAVNSVDASDCENLPYYLIIASLVLANKYLNDQLYTLKLWLSIIRKFLSLLSSLALLNQIETHMLAALNYSLTTVHDLLLWSRYGHLDAVCIRKLRIAGECEQPGAFHPSNSGQKRSFVAMDSNPRTPKATKVPKTLEYAAVKLSEFGSMHLQPSLLLLHISQLLGLATPPSRDPSPLRQSHRMTLHKKSRSMPSHPASTFAAPYPVSASSVTLSSSFMPQMTQFSQPVDTPITAPLQAVNVQGFASVYTTPCSAPMGGFTPRSFNGAYTPLNYKVGSSRISTPSIHAIPFTPSQYATAGIPYLVAHPCHVQTPRSNRLANSSMTNSNFGNFGLNYGNFGKLGGTVLFPKFI